MSSTGEERSLASGIPIPQWMRNKTENYGFDPSSLSPPMHEGEFFYIKFPKAQHREASSLKSLSTVLEGKEDALIRHTESCKKFMPNVQETVQVQKPRVIKPMGVDDGFKGEGAACGTSVVEVAHQMLAGKSFRPLTRGETEGSLIGPPSSSYLQKRRDSKSLPASPTATPESSPLTRRKNNPWSQDRYFAGSFLNNESLNKSDESIDKKSWILANLFAAKERKEDGGNEKSVVAVDPNSKKVVKYKKDSSENLKEPVNVTVEIQAISPAPPARGSFLKSKPHLRDLNLLSPSSM